MATVIDGLSKVEMVLEKLNMPIIDRPVLLEVSGSVHKQKFVRLLGLAEDGDEQSRALLAKACECMSKVAIQFISQLGINEINIPILVNVAFSDDASLFRSSLSAALSGKGEDKNIAYQQVLGFLKGGSDNSMPDGVGNGFNKTGAGNGQQSNSNQGRVNGNGQSNTNMNQSQSNNGRGNATNNSNNVDNSGGFPNRNSQGNNGGGNGNGRNQSNQNVGGGDKPVAPVRELNDYRESKGEAPKSDSERHEDAEYEFMRFFGGKCACCFNKVEKKGKETINVDFAFGSNKVFDWKNKGVFQFGPDELVMLYGVLMGYLKGWESSLHKNQQGVTKTFRIDTQDKGYFMSLNMSGDPSGRALPVSFASSAFLRDFVYSRVKTYFGNQNDELINIWIKKQCELVAGKVQNANGTANSNANRNQGAANNQYGGKNVSHA